MSAITANKGAACLKSISIYGITEGAACMLSMSAIAGFLIGSDYFASSSSYYVECGDQFRYNLSSPEDTYFIESLCLDSFNGYTVVESMSVTDSKSISKVLKAVIDKQMDSIKNVSVSGIKISPEEKQLSLEEFFKSYLDPHHGKPPSDVKYVSQLLTSSLVKFIKQSQFHSLAVSELPESCCYRLVKTFLTTPASHDQTLSLLVKKAGSAMHSIDHLSSSPRHWAAFKTINFNERSDNCKLRRLVANLPELCLKSIHLQAEALISINEEVKIDIPHVCISFRNLLKFPENYVTPLRCGVSRFLCGNISLVTLEFIPGFSFEHSTFFSTINSIFKSLLSKQPDQRQKTLEEIRIQRPDPQYSRDSPDLSMDGLEPPNDFHADETSESYSSHNSKRHNFHSSGSYLADFFILVQEFGKVSLRLPTKLFNDTSIAELRRVVPDLEKRFGDKKIPKITINREYSSLFENMLQLLEAITDVVIVTE